VYDARSKLNELSNNSPLDQEEEFKVIADEKPVREIKIVELEE